jgi:hypothetical protein
MVYIYICVCVFIHIIYIKFMEFMNQFSYLGEHNLVFRDVRRDAYPCPASFVKVHSWCVFFQCLFKKSEAPIGMWMDWIFPAQQVEVREQVLTSFMQECLRSKKEKIMNALPILHNRDLKSFWHTKNSNTIKRFCDFSCVKPLSKKLHKLNG